MITNARLDELRDMARRQPQKGINVVALLDHIETLQDVQWILSGDVEYWKRRALAAEPAVKPREVGTPHHIGQDVEHPVTHELGVITHYFRGADNMWQVQWEGTVARYRNDYLLA